MARFSDVLSARNKTTRCCANVIFECWKGDEQRWKARQTTPEGQDTCFQIICLAFFLHIEKITETISRQS